MALIKRPFEATATPSAVWPDDLGDPRPQTRRDAVEAAPDDADASRRLIEALATEDDTQVRSAVLIALARQSDPAAARTLFGLLRSEDVDLRLGAIEVLRFRPEAVEAEVADLLADADTDVRIFALNLMVDLVHPGLEDWLIRVLERDPHVNVVAAAVEVLAEVGSEQAVDALAALPGRFPDEPFMRFAVDTALRRIRQP